MSNQAETTDATLVQQAMTRQIHRTNKQIEALTRAIDRVDDATELQVKGTLLKTYASQIEGRHHFVVLPDYRNPGQELAIQLDVTKSIMANAEAYFHQYRKDKRGLQTVMSNRDQAEAELKQQVARQKNFEAEDADQVATVKQELITEGALKTKVLHSSKAPEPAHPRRFYTSDHVLVEVGKNSEQNDHLTLTARKDYYWMHVSELAGSHVVIHSNQPSQQTLQEAAVLTAYYSKGRKQSRVPVDVLKVSQLRKPKGAKSGLVTFSGKASTITVRPDAELVKQLRVKE
ncbi:NFACT RNA binding domain-containing protein [Lactiplantibacillus sp. WILCCON 0030]|uniref:NFACT RNA binding domain-containing protein n=1 Tax=Lactiplantibacillus brownii TaxID=3069269 RepID=A0ABU1A6Z9_9LACO|nr:NFACT RNA binding domain-containing protein [Lactiplantibacillus brownii]MDQ7936213.1 NFACT RNA binding domain-containing protein [Lactiplantibacillus brownii]